MKPNKDFSQNFLIDYPHGYFEHGNIYDGYDQQIGYKTKDGKIHINDDYEYPSQFYSFWNSHQGNYDDYDDYFDDDWDLPQYDY